jgi:hypothetical protein
MGKTRAKITEKIAHRIPSLKIRVGILASDQVKQDYGYNHPPAPKNEQGGNHNASDFAPVKFVNFAHADSLK